MPTYYSISRFRQPVKYAIIAFVVLSASIFLLSQIRPFPTVRKSLPHSIPNPVSTPPSSKPNNAPETLRNSTSCHVDLNILKSFGYKSTEYARWEITVVQTPLFKGFSDNLSLPLPTYEPVQLNTKERYQTIPRERCSARTTIEAPLPATSVNASHLIFGIATTVDRLNGNLDAIAHWAGGTNARIFALVEHAKAAKKSEVLRQATEKDIQLTIIESSEEFLERYFTLTKILFQNRNAITQWAVLIDDDTFFPSMSGLIRRLASYDASNPHYVGAPTEDIEQMGRFGYMAYGGAGIFLSIPLLQEINEVFDECAAIQDTGDKRIARCIYSHTSTKLTWDRRFFQMDFHFDASGFYEAGRALPLSLHHWKSPDWFPMDVVGLGKVASFCGDDCQLRRWRISDRWFLINGFSLVQYSSPLTERDLDAMELTWEPNAEAQDEGYAYSLGPLRERDEMKVSFRLRRSIAEGQRLRQFYVHEPDSEHPAQVLEIIWNVAKKKRSSSFH